MDVKHVKQIASYVRATNPDATIVMGGPLSWSYPPMNIMKDIPDIDVIVSREGEQVSLELVEKRREGGSLNQIKGIVFRSKKRLTDTGYAPFIDFDKLPFPDWGLVGLEKRLGILPVETTRGCVYNCAFCSETTYWHKPARFRSVKTVIAEIKRNIEKFNVTMFRFVDSCFTAPEERCAKICDAITAEELNIRWSSYARIDNMNKALLKKMKRAGCVALDIGMESGDLSILGNMGKGYGVEVIKKAIAHARQLDIIAHCNLVVGFPGETRETVDNTIKVLEEAKPDSYSCNILDVAPHTFIYDNLEKYGLTGQRLAWNHQTMNSIEAYGEMQRIYGSASSSHPFLGGEYFASSLISLGYTAADVRDYFSSTHELYRDKDASIPSIDYPLTHFYLHGNPFPILGEPPRTNSNHLTFLRLLLSRVRQYNTSLSYLLSLNSLDHHSVT